MVFVTVETVTVDWISLTAVYIFYDLLSVNFMLR